MLTDDDALVYLSSATVAPITSTIRGVASEVVLDEEDGTKGSCAVNLHNIVTLEQHRLGKRVARFGPVRTNEICAALAYCVGCSLG